MRVSAFVVAIPAALVLAGAALGDPQHYGWGDHGGGRGGGHGGYNGGGNGGDNGGTVIVDPSPYPPPGPYPYPDPYPSAPSPPPGPPGDQSDVAYAPPPAVWFYCDKPAGYFPYVKECQGSWLPLPVMPPPPGAGKPLSTDAFEYCEGSKAYYPYVATCSGHWIAQTASIPDPFAVLENAPPVAEWFYCDASKAYFPFARSCVDNWRHTPAVPPANVAPAPKATAAVP